MEEILKTSRSGDAIVVCVSDCQIGDVAEKLGYNHTFKTLNRVMNPDNVVHHLSGLRIGAN